MKELIKNALEKAGISQKELASKLNVSPQAVSKWINGESEPSKDNIIQIYNILGINLNDELIKKGRKEKMANLQKQPKDLNELNDIDKAEQESKKILELAGIKRNYPRSIYVGLCWLVTATIGLTYHECIHKKDVFDKYDYDCIYYNLESYFDSNDRYHTALEYYFYLLGGDLFESWGEYKLSNHDYARDSLELWHRFKKTFYKDKNGGKTYESHSEFIAALQEVLAFLNEEEPL